MLQATIMIRQMGHTGGVQHVIICAQVALLNGTHVLLVMLQIIEFLTERHVHALMPAIFNTEIKQPANYALLTSQTVKSATTKLFA